MNDAVNRCAGCGMDVGPSPGWHTDEQHAERLRILATHTQFQLLDAFLKERERSERWREVGLFANDVRMGAMPVDKWLEMFNAALAADNDPPATGGER